MEITLESGRTHRPNQKPAVPSQNLKKKLPKLLHFVI